MVGSVVVIWVTLYFKGIYIVLILITTTYTNNIELQLGLGFGLGLVTFNLILSIL